MIPLKISVFLKKKHVNDFILIPQPNSLVIELHNNFSDGGFCCDSVLRTNFFENNAKSIYFKVTMDGYLCSLLQYVLNTSVAYRTCLSEHIFNKHAYKRSPNYIVVHIKLTSPEREMLDYRGNEMFEVLCLERRELDVAMAWLSTLGGAFSALGDSIEKCAAIAGKISVRQMEIALRLGDPFLVSRCKLYMALSLIQRQKFRLAKELIRIQYKVATQGPIIDNKLKSMCFGIWAKLKYDKKIFKKETLRNKKQLLNKH